MLYCDRLVYKLEDLQRLRSSLLHQLEQDTQNLLLSFQKALKRLRCQIQTDINEKCERLKREIEIAMQTLGRTSETNSYFYFRVFKKADFSMQVQANYSQTFKKLKKQFKQQMEMQASELKGDSCDLRGKWQNVLCVGGWVVLVGSNFIRTVKNCASQQLEFEDKIKYSCRSGQRLVVVDQKRITIFSLPLKLETSYQHSARQDDNFSRGLLSQVVCNGAEGTTVFELGQSTLGQNPLRGEWARVCPVEERSLYVGLSPNKIGFFYNKELFSFIQNRLAIQEVFNGDNSLVGVSDSALISFSYAGEVLRRVLLKGVPLLQELDSGLLVDLRTLNVVENGSLERHRLRVKIRSKVQRLAWGQENRIYVIQEGRCKLLLEGSEL